MTIQVDVKFGREHLTAKTMSAFDHIYEHHINEADWFLKADDDTYVIVENMRYFLSGQNPNASIYFGHHFKPYVKQVLSANHYEILFRIIRRRLCLYIHSNSMTLRKQWFKYFNFKASKKLWIIRLYIVQPVMFFL